MHHHSSPSRRSRALLAGLAALALPALALPALAVPPADAAARAAVVLTGVVTDSTGAPVVGACPQWGSSLCGSGELTDSTGTFRRQLFLDESVTDTVALTIVPASGDLMHEQAPLTVTREAGWKADLTVAALGVLRGVAVDDATGKPVSGACPMRWDAPGMGWSKGAICSGADGVWTLGWLPAGQYAVALRHPVLVDSFVPTGTTYAAARKTTVVVDQVTTVATTRLTAGASVVVPKGTSAWQLQLKPVSNDNDLVTQEVSALADPEHPGTWVGIEPGTYELRLEWNRDCIDDCYGDRTVDGAPVWYPGSYDPADSVAVALTGGKSLTWTGPVPAFGHVTAVVKGLPAGSRVGILAAYPSGVEVPTWNSTTSQIQKKKTIQAYRATLPPVPLKLRLVARKPDGTVLTWWYGGTSLETAALVKTGATVRTTAPKNPKK